MKSARSSILLGLFLLLSGTEGCGCVTNRQVIVNHRAGAPIQVDTTDGVKVKAPFVDVRVPAGKTVQAGQVDVPIVEPD